MGQSPRIPTELVEHKKRPLHMTLDIHVLAWDRHNIVFHYIYCKSR